MASDLSNDQLTLRTPRLRLRPIGAGDAHDFFEIHADPEAMRYWSTPPWTDPAHAIHVIDGDEIERIAGRSIRFVVIEAASDRLIGCCSLHRIDTIQGRCEVGYILRRSHWGRGLAQEAMTAVVDFAFGSLAMRRLEADVDPRNESSTRTLARLGFRLDALLRARWLVDGQVSDSAIYGLLRNDRTS